MKDKIKPGSPFLFCLIKTLNLFFGATALSLFGMSIWLWTQLGGFSIVEIVFMTLGVFQVFLVFLAWTAKTSASKLKCYLFLLSILFLLELVATIIVFALGDQIVNAVAEKTSTTEQIQQFKDYLFIVNYFVIGTLVVELLLIMFVYCYIGSLSNTNQEYDYRVMDSEGNKFTVEEKQQSDKNKIQEKYARKRQQLKQKYPGYRPGGN